MTSLPSGAAFGAGEPAEDAQRAWRSLPVEGGSLAYAVSGQGPAIVFAHGLGGNIRSWWQQVPALEERYTCIIFSHRGFAPSTDDRGRPRPHRYAQDLRTLLDHLRQATVSIVAQSMGGWTALEFALEWPDRVEALVLCGTTGSLSHPDVLPLASAAASPEAVACRAAHISPAAGRRMAAEQPNLYRLYTEIDDASGAWDRGAVRAELDAMRTRPPRALGVLNCPVLAVVGAEDIVCPPSSVRTLADCPIDLRMHMVPECGHSVYFERAQLFNAMIADFLGRIEVRSC